MSKIIYKKLETVKCINIEPLNGNEVAPPLELNKEYLIKDIVLDEKGNQHLDVGLISEYNYIRSIETEEELPNGKEIHWCHPSRFEPIF
jgi:hypothetical protein